MKKFLLIIKMQILDAFIDRANIFLWTLTGITQPLVMLGIWLAILASGGKTPLSGSEFVRYYLILIIVNAWTAAWASQFIATEIRLGKISPFLIRPISYWIFLLGNNIGEKTMKFVVLFIPFFLLTRVFHLSFENLTFFQFAMFIISCVAASLLTFFVDLSVGFVAFWLDDVTAVGEGTDFSFYIFSGQLIPLIALPSVLRYIANVLPFRYMLSFPIEILTTQLSTKATMAGIAVQFFWLGIVIISCSMLWSRGVRRYSAVGA